MRGVRASGARAPHELMNVSGFRGGRRSLGNGDVPPVALPEGWGASWTAAHAPACTGPTKPRPFLHGNPPAWGNRGGEAPTTTEEQPSQLLPPGETGGDTGRV